jgi:excisionase family DNA binding protein
MNKIMTLEEVASFLKVHPSTVYRLLQRHKIPAFKMGSDWRFNQESIERWIAEQETANSELPMSATEGLAPTIRKRSMSTGRPTRGVRS